jgi:hypothetical protein
VQDISPEFLWREKTQKLKIANVQAEIWTWGLPNTSQKCYAWANALAENLNYFLEQREG